METVIDYVSSWSGSQVTIFLWLIFILWHVLKIEMILQKKNKDAAQNSYHELTEKANDDDSNITSGK